MESPAERVAESSAEPVAERPAEPVVESPADTGVESRGEPDVASRFTAVNDLPVTPPPPAVARPVAPGLDWRVIAAITVAAAVVAWIAAAAQPPRYRASALAAIGPLSDQLGPYEVLRGVDVLERRTVIATVTALAATPATRARVAADDGYRIEATVVPDTNLVRVNVEGTDASRAAAIANRIPGIVHAQTQEMFKYYGVKMVSPAVRPDEPFFPRKGRAATAGVLIGLFLGSLVSYAARRSRT